MNDIQKTVLQDGTGRNGYIGIFSEQLIGVPENDVSA